MYFLCGEKLAAILQPLIEDVYLQSKKKKKKHTNNNLNGRYTNCISSHRKKRK